MNEAISFNLWAKLRVIGAKIKKWYQEAGINDPCKIAKLEEDIERLEKGRQTSQACETIKNEVMEKRLLCGLFIELMNGR